MNRFDDSTREFTLVALLASVFLVFDLAIALIQGHALPAVGILVAAVEGFTVGTLFAQVVILALWAGLTSGATVTRSSYALLLLVGGAILLHGFVDRFTPEVLRIRTYWAADYFGWLFLVVVFSALQLAVSGVRRCTGYSLALHATQLRRDENIRQFTLAELLGTPVLLCAPLIAMTAILEVMNAAFVLTVLVGLVVICLLYASFHICGLLRTDPSALHLAILLLLGPLFLIPASLFFTGQILGGTLYGIPFVCILCCTHLGALAIGLPTAAVARLIGYRLHFRYPAGDDSSCLHQLAVTASATKVSSHDSA